MSQSSYDFFYAQRYHKKLSLYFFGLFTLAFMVQAVFLFLLSVGLVWVWTGNIDLSYWTVSIIAILVYIVFGMLWGNHKFGKGGVAFAKELGAVRLFVDQSGQNGDEPVYFPTFIRVSNPDDLPSGYARFYEFASQMSIASGIALPKLYVLPNQTAINACVAGHDESDTVLILTQGAVDNLDNDGLYGLIGHEFGHILHGDGKLNLRIAIMMAGLSWIYECAEWLEVLFLGRFNANYHATMYGQSATPLASQSDWIRHWQNARYYSAKRESSAETEAGLLWLHLSIAGFLVAIRLLGLFGMMIHDMLIHYFNKHREFLADATSVQLTRSFGVVKALEGLRHSSGQLSDDLKNNISHHGYFFFANPNEDKRFGTHPETEARIQAINEHWYDDFGQLMTAQMDKKTLQSAHDIAHIHEPIVPLNQELIDKPLDEPYQKVDFESVPEQIVDGKLVMDAQWYDWHDEDKVETVWVNKTHWQLPTPFEPTHLKGLQIPWTLTKHRRHHVGVLSVIEGLLLCRFGQVELQTNLYDVYIKPYHEPQDITPHDLNEELVKGLAMIDRRCDGVLLVKSLHSLMSYARQPDALDDKHLKILERYQLGLLELVACYHNQEVGSTVNVSQLHKKLPLFYQGAVLATMIKALDPIKSAGEALDSAYLAKKLNLGHLDTTHALWLMVFALLVGVQDNSLLLQEYDKMTAAFVRWSRLVEAPLLDTDNIITLLHAVHELGVVDWAVCLYGLGQSAINAELFYTMFLYDANISQLESDLYYLFAELFE